MSSLFPIRPVPPVKPEVVRVEKNLTALGFFTPSHKRLDGVNEKRVTVMVREANGQRLEASARILPSAKLGLPITADQDKYYAFLNLLEYRRDNDGRIENPVQFTTNELLKVLGLKKCGRNYEEVREWLGRMTFTGIESEGVVYLAKAKRYARDRFTVFSRAVSVGEELDGGRIADSNYVWLSEWQLQNLNERYVAPIQFDVYRRLRNHIAKALVPLLQIWFFAVRYQPAMTIRKGYQNLSELLHITYYTHRSRIMSSIGPSMDELKEHHFLTDWTIERTADNQGWNVVMTAGPAIIARQRLGSSEIRDPKFEQLIVELKQRGVTEEGARRLLLDTSETQPVLDQIEWVDAQIRLSAQRKEPIANPPGMYVWAIRTNVAIPADFVTSGRRQAEQEAAEASETARTRQARLELLYARYRDAEGQKALERMTRPERKLRTHHVEREFQKLYPHARLSGEVLERALISELLGTIDILNFDEFVSMHQPGLFEDAGVAG